MRASARAVPAAALSLLLAGCDAVDEPLLNATGYVAHMSCSCVFNTGRSLDACLDDLPREARWLDLELDREARTVTANAFWIDTVAVYGEGRGCRLRD